jgi:hypothetical protein
MFRLLAPLAAHTKLLACAGVCATSLCAAPLAVHAFQGNHGNNPQRTEDTRGHNDRFTGNNFGDHRGAANHDTNSRHPGHDHESFSAGFHNHRGW